MGTPHGMYCIHLLAGFGHFLKCSLLVMGIPYTCITRWAFGVARFDKLGDARASARGTSNRSGSTFSYLYVLARKFRQQRSRLALFVNENG